MTQQGESSGNHRRTGSMMKTIAHNPTPSILSRILRWIRPGSSSRGVTPSAAAMPCCSYTDEPAHGGKVNRIPFSQFEFEVIRSARGPVLILAHLVGRVGIVGFRSGVFYGWKGGGYRFHSMEANVSPAYRRRGVASAILRHLFDRCDVYLVTADDATDDGAAFMRAAGFTVDPVQQNWVLTRSTWLAARQSAAASSR